MQKARHHTGLLHGALTVCRHTVSGSISLPSRGSFQLSLTVLSAIGGKEYLALDGGPPRFTQDFSCPALLRITLVTTTISFTGLSPSLVDLPKSFYYRCLHMLSSYNPTEKNSVVWADPRSLAATKGISIDFCSSRY